MAVLNILTPLIGRFCLFFDNLAFTVMFFPPLNVFIFLMFFLSPCDFISLQISWHEFLGNNG